jgi:hypothetical protein
MERKIHIGNKWWKLMTIQYSKEKKTTEDAIKENREDRILLGGDFNGTIGEKRARNWEEQRGEGKRKSKDKVDNAEGKRLMEWIEENGWEVLNGNKQGHEEAEWTYKYLGSRGETVIDYGIANEEAWERVEKFRIGERVEWDHLEIALRKRRGGTEQRRKEVGDRNKTVYLICFSLELLFYV